MFMPRVKAGTKRVSPGAARSWRASRAAAFFSTLNGDGSDIESLAERFPQRLRGRLVACLVGVTVVAIVVRAPLFGNGITASDTTVYLKVAREILHGTYPSDLRPPGYSLLLAAFEGVGIDPVAGVVTVQNLIGVILPACVLLVGWRFFQPAVGIVAGLLTAASPLMIVTEQLALADYLFSVALLAGAALLAEAVLRIRMGQSPRRLLFMTGVLFGLATMFRANGQLALVAIPLMLLIATGSLRKAIRPVAVAIAGMLIVVVPWVLCNTIVYGQVTVATEGGISLYARAISWDEVPPSPNSADGRLALSIYNTADISKPRPALETTTAVYDALVNEGKTQAQASSAMGAIAKEAIFRDPGAFLDGTFEILGLYRSLYDPHTFTANQYLDQIIVVRNYFRSLHPELRNVPGDSSLTRVPWQVAQSLTKLLYSVTLGGILVLLLPFLGKVGRRLASSVFLLFVLLGALAGCLTAVFSPRYDIMFAPMVWILLSATAVLIVEAIATAIRQRPWLRSRDTSS
jgi:4-amino-4-deoxy-L-arabinose transferase-like glycosyltransferase